MSKHTPAPWTVVELKTNDGYRTALRVENGLEFVCDLNTAEFTNDNDEFEANARLIAAAPELLEALRWCIAALNSRGIDSSTGELDRAKEVLAKATGGAE